MYKDMIDTIGYVKQADPELGEAMDRELGRQRQNIELIAQREHCFPRRHGGYGQRADQQVCRGLPRQPLLRRLPVRG